MNVVFSKVFRCQAHLGVCIPEKKIGLQNIVESIHFNRILAILVYFFHAHLLLFKFNLRKLAD